MSNLRELPQNNAPFDQASDWIARMDRGLSADEEAALGRWVGESERNRAALMDVARLWDRMDALAKLAVICPETPRRRLQPERYAWAAAASLILAVVASWAVFSVGLPGGQPEETAAVWSREYETAVGELSSFRLGDGTEIVLNTNSRVSVTYTRNNRILKLERGEMHVDVAHDRSRRLSVMAGSRVVQAVGTEFNVEITSDKSIELVVTDGVVLVGIVDAPADDGASDRPIVLTRSSTLVAAGQEAIIGGETDEDTGMRTETIEDQEIAVKLSWRQGNLIFRGESLEEAISEIGRYTAVEFVFLDDESKKVRVAGLFKAGDVDGLLSTLRENFDIAYEWVGDETVVLRGE